MYFLLHRFSLKNETDIEKKFKFSALKLELLKEKELKLMKIF